MLTLCPSIGSVNWGFSRGVGFSRHSGECNIHDICLSSPGSICTMDTSTTDWNQGEKIYLFPLRVHLSRVLFQLQTFRGLTLLVVPRWPVRLLFPLPQSLAIQTIFPIRTCLRRCRFSFSFLGNLISTFMWFFFWDCHVLQSLGNR